MAIEIESPEELGFDKIRYNLCESSMTDLKFGELGLSLEQLDLSYIAHRGNREFRKQLAEDYGNLDKDDILITNGAACALFIINSSILSKSDHMVVLRPNYATNIEVPRAIGCSISFVDLVFEEGWAVNLAAIEAALRPETKLISITTPHNPTGMLMREVDIRNLVALAEEKQIMLLVDETYRDTCFKTNIPLAATLSQQVISVNSLSKAFGLPGLRIGWLVTKNRHWMDIFFAAKEMIYINNSALDEEVAWQFYKKKEQFAAILNPRAQENFAVLKNWLAREQRLEAVLPQGGVVCFPRFRDGLEVDSRKFYELLLNKFETMVGPGHWFEMPDRYMRIGFGWYNASDFAEGLKRISKTIDLSVG